MNIFRFHPRKLSDNRSVAMKHVSRIQEDRNREQLLTMRFTTNAASRSPMQAANGSDTSLLIDGALEHRGALDVSVLM